MSEYVRKDDVVRAAKFATMLFEVNYRYALEAAGAKVVLEAVSKVEPVDDVAEVVRCKDCVHFVRYRESGIGECHRIDDGEPSEMNYCSYGRRR